MSQEASESGKNEQVDPTHLAEVIAKIKQPPSINETLMDASPEELKSNPAVAPQMLDEGSDLRDDLKRD